MKPFQNCALLIIILLVFGGAAFPQASSSSLQGTVTDPSGSAIAGAAVVLANAESRIERTVTTGPQGEYRLLALPPGTYTLTVTARGFARSSQTGLQLLVNTPATANVQLKVGSATESVTVTSEAPALNLVDASIGNPFNETQVRQLPLDGRNVPDLLSLQSGVAYTGNRSDMAAHTTYADQDTRNGSVNGARSDQSNVTLDGVNVNDEAKGYAFTSVLPVTPDSVEEFRVTTTNYNADQGDGSGAQVALVTKSGTNHMHGSLYEYHRNTLTSANDWFNQAAEVESGQPNKPLKLIRNVFGGSLGGPIKKDRAFYFVNYEGTRQREEHSVLRNIPTPSFLDGVIQYQCASACPASGYVTGLSGKQYAYSPGYYAMGPAQIKSFDPGGPNFGDASCTTQGVNTCLLRNYFIPSYGKFVANDNSVGDGLNYSGFRFRAPFRYDNNAFIARFDYHLTADGKHTLFWRGSLQNVYNPQEEFLPGTAPEHIVTDHSKGFAVGYTAVPNARTVNTFRYGFTRQSLGNVGNSTQEWNQFYTLDQGYTYTDNFQLPTHNLIDDFSWTKGTHTLQVGGNLGFARNPRFSYQHSFYEGLGATFWMAPVGFSNTGGESLLDPLYYKGDPNYSSGAPEPASSTAYDLPMLGLLGIVSDVKANVNYNKLGQTIAEGTPIRRRYGMNWYEFYGQDVWRVRPNVTLTYGLRWSLFPPPWEVNGLQASPTFNLGDWFNQNMQNMKNGLGYADGLPITFVLGGKANGGTDFYHFEKTDFSPRLSIAYAPRPHGGILRKLFGENDATVIRAGFSRVYDRAGMQLLSTFDAEAPGGLAATIQNPCCTLAYTAANTAARVTDPNKVPVNYLLPQIGGSLPPGTFPQTPCSYCEAITWNVDQSLKSPNSYAVDFSIGRELPNRFSLQVAYVGRFGRNLLTQRDLSQPLDLVDKSSGIDYYTAATVLSQLARNGVPYTAVSSNSVGKTSKYWQDLIMAQGTSKAVGPPGPTSPTFVVPTGQIQNASPVYYNTKDVVQAEYSLFTSSGAYAGDEVVGLANTDIYYYLADNATPTPNYYFFNGKVGELLNNQMTSMYGWSSIGDSNYNALQATLKKQTGHGVQFDFNYTYAKSIDITSGAARLGFSGSDNIGAPGSRLPNAFYPNVFRAVSDFDTSHQFNANWIVELPFGKGKAVASHASGATEAIVGGWQLSGLARWTTGFPFTVDNGQFWPTDWDEQGSAQQTGHPKAGAFVQPDGHVSAFQNPAAVQANNFFHPFPGGSGTRNGVRGQGYAGWDMALAKRWPMPLEGHSLQFRWEVFNVTNLHRFNALAGLGDGAPSLQELPQLFGVYTGLLTQPRVMQFALRYEF